MKTVYIHGANASSVSFNYIRHFIKGDDILIDYDCKNDFEYNLKNMKQQLRDQGDLFFVAHSLGGIYSLHLYEEFTDLVKGAATISTPYGGSEIADLAKYLLPYNTLLRNVSTNSWPIKHGQEIKPKCPWTNIVTIKGNSEWITSKNDGVVSLSSMRSRKDFQLIDIELNHYEIVLSPLTVDILKNKIAQNE